MKKVLKSICLLLILLVVASCSSGSDDSITPTSANNTITLKLNGVLQTATVTSAILAKAQQINHKTLFIVAENTEYKFNLKLISDYNDSSDAIPLGQYNFDNVQTAVFYSEFFIYHKINGVNVSFHFPDASIYNISSCNSNEKNISGSFTSMLHSVNGEDTNQGGVFVPNIIEITNGVLNNIEYTVTEY